MPETFEQIQHEDDPDISQMSDEELKTWVEKVWGGHIEATDPDKLKQVMMNVLTLIDVDVQQQRYSKERGVELISRLEEVGNLPGLSSIIPERLKPVQTE